jgi:drug/metabolite transporter (DMT)-like permease
VIGPLLLMLGLARTEASLAALLLNLEGLATMGIAWLVFREHVDRRLLLGAAAILTGAGILSWGGPGVRVQIGAISIAAACLAWGVDNNLTRKLSSADPMIKGIAAGSVNVIIAVFNDAATPPAGTLAAAALLGFLAVGISLVLFVLALRHLGTARAGAYFSLAPFIGALVAVGLLHNPVTLQLLLAGGLMGVGLWLHLDERHEHTHAHEPLEHEHAHIHDEHHQHPHDGATIEPHSHWHRHGPMRHKHVHYPDPHHQHPHR